MSRPEDRVASAGPAHPAPPRTSGSGRPGESRRLLTGNLFARVIALISLAVSTLVVARVGGPSGVGVFALLRVLPSLVGVLLSAGLPTGIVYFLAGSRRRDPRLVPTIIAIALAAGIAGSIAWVAGASVLARAFFRGVSVRLIALSGLTVLTQLFVATAKGASQGTGDLPGANRIIILEELMFLPAYVIAIGASLKGEVAVILALVLADVFTIVVGWWRLVRGHFFRHVGRPSVEVAREVTGYGLRGQVGAVLSLLNLRLDFLLLAALAGDVTLGVYAVASKFAELLRLPPLALTYVLYPRFSREERRARVRGARTLIPRAGLFVAAAAVPLAIGARFLLPVIYGDAFRSAIVPTFILLVGLAGEGVAGVITAFLYGEARPGMNSLAMGAGVLVTVCLDLLLIPRFHAVGAAWASSAAYLTSTAMLYAIFRRLTRREDDDDEPLRVAR